MITGFVFLSGYARAARSMHAMEKSCYDRSALGSVISITGSHLMQTLQRLQLLRLINVTWNQGNGWNRFCPEDEEGPGGHVYAGCVAVSMAQAMSVFGAPSKGKGSYQYTAP